MSSTFLKQLQAEGPFNTLPAGTTETGSEVTVTYMLPRLNHSLFVVATGTPTAGSIQLQVSQDGTNWYNLGSALTINANGVFAVTGQAVAQYARAHVATTVSGGTGSVSASISGY